MIKYIGKAIAIHWLYALNEAFGIIMRYFYNGNYVILRKVLEIVTGMHLGQRFESSRVLLVTVAFTVCSYNKAR